MNLVWQTMWCEKHLLPLKAKWPHRASHAMLGIFNAACENEEIMRRCGKDIDNLALVFNSIKPVCCFLPEGKAEEIVKLALEGKVYGEK